MVAALGVDGEGADDFAGGGVDDADVELVDEQDDAGSVEGSSEADVVDWPLMRRLTLPDWMRSWRTRNSLSGWSLPGAGFGSGGVGDGGCGVVWE